MNKLKPLLLIFLICTFGLALVGGVLEYGAALIDGRSTASTFEYVTATAISFASYGALIGILIAAGYFWTKNPGLQQWKADNIHKQSDSQVEADGDGFFFYVACDKCNDHLRLRVTRQYDLERQEGGGYLWRKTIVDGRCFRKMEATVQFDNAYRVIEKQIEGGRFVDHETWNLNR